MSAIDTFRRAMRRHEQRARRMGIRLGDFFIMMCAVDGSYLAEDWAMHAREIRDVTPSRGLRRADRRYNMQLAWIYERAADAVARYLKAVAP